jgi:ribosomal protein S4E
VNPQGTPPKYVPETIEQVHPQIVREWYFDKRIVAYRLTNVSQEIVNAWANVIAKTLESWSKDKPYLVFHDISNPGIALQYATLVNFDLMNIGVLPSRRQDIEDIFNAHPGWQARVAIGFNLSVSGQVSQVVMDRIKNRHPAILYKTFFNKDKSMTWLADALKPAANAE